MVVAGGGVVTVGGTGVYVGSVAEAVGPGVRDDAVAVELAVGVADGGGEGDSRVVGDEAVTEGGAGTGVSVGSGVDAPNAIRVDFGVDAGPDEDRHAATRVPIAARPRLTKRRREIRPSTFTPRSRPVCSSRLEFISSPFNPLHRSARHLESGPHSRSKSTASSDSRSIARPRARSSKSNSAVWWPHPPRSAPIPMLVACPPRCWTRSIM